MDKMMWSAIVQKGDERTDRKVREEGKAKYTSMWNLLTGYMEERDNVWTVRRRTALYCGLDGWRP